MSQNAWSEFHTADYCFDWQLTVCVYVTEPAYEMSEEEKEMMNVMGFFAFSTTKVTTGLGLFLPIFKK